MSIKKLLLSTDELKAKYGGFYDQALRMASEEGRKRFGGIRKEKVPEQFWPLIPYAELWGEIDDRVREDLLDIAPREAIRDMRTAYRRYEAFIDEQWLERPETDRESVEFLTFAILAIVGS